MMAVRYFEEMRRRYYTTPSSYLDLIKLYLNTLQMKSSKIENRRSKIANGLDVSLSKIISQVVHDVKIYFVLQKLKETNEMVSTMKEQIILLKPQLKINSEEVAKLMVIVAKEKKEVDKVKEIVAADEAKAKVFQ